ncbi:LOW QUALITY PROTEIN: polycystin-2 [Drosophila gunungcola]|nr:LOW QUALITY PROTEIN: polycystin-2 [Drosophila gunungcola]
MAKKSSNMIFYLTFVIIAGCAVCIWRFSGFNHEPGKFHKILVAFLAVTLIRLLIFTPIKFVIMALDAACWPPHQAPVTLDEDVKVETLIDSLRLKLRTLRSELLVTESHRNEAINLKYRLINEELCLTGKLFLGGLGMILVIFDENLYYNTDTVNYLFKQNHKNTSGLSTLSTLPHVYKFIEYSLIRAFTDKHNTAGGAPWVNAESVRLLGVVRLRQLRTEDTHMGLRTPVLTSRDYLAGWQLPYVRVPYTNKFWPIYRPWVASVFHFRDILMGFSHYGHFISYPENMGYLCLLSDTRMKSLMILEYLHKKKWLDRNTSALFMDFTLYNADANIFSVCTLWVEQFPLGSIHYHIEVQSNVFVEQMEQITALGMLMLFIFVIIWLQFAKAFFVKVWYEPNLLKTLWVLVDATIVFLSLVVVVIHGFRDNLVQNMLQQVELSVLMKFIDFREPSRLTYFADVFKGFALALVTMRLWKVMQFSGTFQLFTETLYNTWRALLWTIIITIIFIASIGIAAVAINGTNTMHFSNLPSGIVSVVCFVFGYTNLVGPKDLFYGGKWLGIILYAMLGFVVKFLLINLIVSLLRAQLMSAKVKRDHKVLHSISFLQFLRVEYADLINFIMKATRFQKRYKRKNRTVAENIQRKLDERLDSQDYMKSIRHRKTDEELIQLRYRERIERTLTLAKILQTQMELIERLKFGDEEGNLPNLVEAEEPGPSN